MLQFQFGLFRNFPITVSLLTLPFALHFLFSGKANPGIKIVLFSILCLNIIVYFTEIGTFDEIQWIQTFMLFLLTYYGIYYVSRDSIQNTEILVSAVKIVIPVCTIFSLMQMLFGFGKFSWLDTPFGNYSNLNTHKLDFLASISRAPGFYIEPSYNALVAICLLPVIALLKSNKQRVIYLILISFWLLATRSFSGLMTITFILFLKIIFTKKKRSIDLFILIIYGIAISTYIITRFKTIAEPGSSAYFRLVSPIKIFVSNLENYPIGVPLGVREQLVLSADQRLENSLATSIDNGWLYILIYFGFIGIFLLILIIIFCMRLSAKLKYSGNEYWLFSFLPFTTLGFTGGITMPEFILLNAVMINLIRGCSAQITSANKALLDLK